MAKGLVLLDCPAQSLLELAEQVTRVESLSPELRGQLRDPRTSSRPQAPAPAEQFQWSVRWATNFHDLLAALDAFLEEVTVLPLGRWDPTAQIPPPKCLPSEHKSLVPGLRNPGSCADRAHCWLLGGAGKLPGHGSGWSCLLPDADQPLVSSTGPVLVFEHLLFSFSRDHSLDYLPFCLWVGIWVAPFCLVLVATEASVLVHYFTRFTEEGFCALISLIFIYDAVGKMLTLTRAYPIQRPGSPTYGCQYSDPGGNESQWTSTKPKDRDGIFSVHVKTSRFFPSMVSVTSLSVGENWLLASGPVCKWERGPKEGDGGLNLTECLLGGQVCKMLGDFFSVLAILLGCGLDAFLGLATLKLTVSREFKLTVTPSRLPEYPAFLLLLFPQFTKRVQLLLMPAKHQPDLLLLWHVPLRRVHFFTAIQLACLGLLWIVKSTPAAIIFPLMLLDLVGVRKALEWVFSPQELLWLDEPMPEKERSITEKGLEPEYSFSGSDNEDVSSRMGPLRRTGQGLGREVFSRTRADVSAIGSGNQHLCELSGMELGLQETEREVFTQEVRTLLAFG
ncbi:hypothetical protein E2I00_000262 [Balaenoptera physalus]|uniref:Bicarbonate transporter-like transmembrane domain-containing protein n=1 Tax=Balaenoptera physalus TaxID=9770 RepID=A0A643BWG7_BALPH|nr:hypothetical protein E2I00_000262 [Balaenoptera physalus]